MPMQKHSLAAFGLLSFVLSMGCNSPSEVSMHSPTGAAGIAPLELNFKKVEALATDVPKDFTEADRWNQKALCPEGAILSPFVRYTYLPGEQNYGFKHYFGRSCNVQRKSLTVPHGPYMWWYQNGKRMGAGTFDHGSLATDWIRWTPDGSLASK